MTQKLRNLKKGDEIEIAFCTHDGKIWHPGTIDRIDANFIHASYPSGHQKKIDRSDTDMYRLPVNG